MADQRAGGIGWTDQTWNPTRGCTRVSEGCRNCYAETVAHRFSGKGRPYEGLTNAQGRWNGAIRVVEEHLLDPLRWQRPRRVFVNSMSDLFHEAVSDETIDRIFAVMALAPRHTFQVLTKRPERMRAWFDVTRNGCSRLAFVAKASHEMFGGNHVAAWPLPNVWLGVSVEDQATADARIPLLLQTPAAVRFVSAEPLLGPVSLGKWLTSRGECIYIDGRPARGLDWAIVGGESGPGARPFDVEWARALVQQCRTASVACFVKQLGAKPYDHDGDCLGCPDCGNRDCGTAFDLELETKKGDNPAEWPEDLRVQEFPCS